MKACYKACYKCKAVFEGSTTYCVPCQRAYDAAKYQKNRERMLAKGKEWREANREKAAALTKVWANANREKCNSKVRAWRKRNMVHDAARACERRAIRKQATPTWRNPFFLEEAHDLAKRRSVATGFYWQVDHIVPLTSDLVCGLHVENNIQVIPARDNQAKGNRHWPDMP